MTDPHDTTRIIAVRHCTLDDRCKKHLITDDQQAVIDLLREAVERCYYRDSFGLLHERDWMTLPLTKSGLTA